MGRCSPDTQALNEVRPLNAAPTYLTVQNQLDGEVGLHPFEPDRQTWFSKKLIPMNDGDEVMRSTINSHD